MNIQCKSYCKTNLAVIILLIKFSDSITMPSDLGVIENRNNYSSRLERIFRLYSYVWHVYDVFNNTYFHFIRFSYLIYPNIYSWLWFSISLWLPQCAISLWRPIYFSKQNERAVDYNRYKNFQKKLSSLHATKMIIP